MPWRILLPELLANDSLRTQDDLVRALGERGHAVTQATVSRELKRMGVTKVDGAYRLPPRPEIGAPIHAFTATAQDCFVVIRTDPAFATVVAQAIDAAAFKVETSFKDEVTLNVYIYAKPGAGVDSQTFFITLRPKGQGTKTQWLVTNFVPSSGVPPVPAPDAV